MKMDRLEVLQRLFLAMLHLDNKLLRLILDAAVGGLESEAFDLYQATCRSIWKTENVRAMFGGPPIPEEKQIIRLRKAGWSFAEISQAVGKSEHACEKTFYASIGAGNDPLLDRLRKVHGTEIGSRKVAHK